MGSKAFGGLNRRLKENTAESRWFETTGQAPFGAKAASWKIKRGVARTTNTAHIAAVLGKLGRKVLVWDLDVNYGLTSHFGIPAMAYIDIAAS